MERVLDTYTQPYDPDYPVICFDERPCYLIEQTLQPVAMKVGQVKREDYNYSVKSYSVKASCSVLLAVEPLTGRRWAKLYDRRRRQEYTDFMQFLEKQFPEAQKIRLVQDNLNTHNPGSFYAALEPQDAFLLAQRFEMIYTPKHASWLNMRAGPVEAQAEHAVLLKTAELEFSALSKQCLDRRIAERDFLETELAAWEAQRNQAQVKLIWQFSKENARKTFARTYTDIRVSL